MLVFEELVYQEALRRKMTVSAAKLQRSEADCRKTFPSPDEFNAFLQSEFHGSQPLLDQKIRRSLLIDDLLRIEVENKSTVTPAEVRAYFDHYPGRFSASRIVYLPEHLRAASRQGDGRAIEGRGHARRERAPPGQGDQDR